MCAHRCWAGGPSGHKEAAENPPLKGGKVSPGSSVSSVTKRNRILSTRIMVRTKSLMTKSKPPTLRVTGRLREGLMLSQLTTLGPGRRREDKRVLRFPPGLETGLVKQMTCQGDVMTRGGGRASPAGSAHTAPIHPPNRNPHS